MKTKIILTCCFVAVFTAIQLSACNKGGSQQAESAHIAEAQTQENALNEQVTYDLAFLELHGPVHVVKESYIDVSDKYSWDGRTHTFSKDGKIVKVGNYDPFDVSKDIYDDPEQAMVKYTRDSEGRITEMAMWESIENYIGRICASPPPSGWQKASRAQSSFTTMPKASSTMPTALKKWAMP